MAEAALQVETAETPPAAQENGGAKELAVKKLEAELEKKNVKASDKMIIRYLVGRCTEDQGMAEDVLQEHKTYEKCYRYVNGKARNEAKDGAAVIEDSVVYEWAEDYYHLDDKAEEEKKAKETAERAEAAKKREEERKKKAAEEKKKKTVNKEAKQEKKEQAEETPKTPPKKKEVEGQMSIFDMM